MFFNKNSTCYLTLNVVNNKYKNYSSDFTYHKYNNDLFININNKRFYSSSISRNKNINHFSKILNDLFIKNISKDYISNRESQLKIESMIFDHYEAFFKDFKGYSLDGISTKTFSKEFVDFVLSKESDLKQSIDNLIRYYKNPNSKLDKNLVNIFSAIDAPFIYNLALTFFLKVCTYQGTNDTNNQNIVSVAIEMGKRIISKYLYLLRKKNETNEKYRIWYNNLDEDLKNILEDDTFITELGAKILDILMSNTMIYKRVLILNITSKQYILEVDTKLINQNKNFLVNLPFKLPMIIPPKKYTEDDLGGYLLNDERYQEELIIPKSIFKQKSVINSNNTIYSMVNSMMQTPFKVNTELLDFILKNGLKYNLLLDSTIPHKYEVLEKKSKYHQTQIASYNSKLVLQKTILSIVDLYRHFPEIYFPIRLDQRGRLYCNTSYFSYQGNELARTLLLFSKPTIIDRTNLDVIQYLLIYGANCYGKNKLSEVNKINWVKDNVDNIINYDNGILLSKAKTKLPFLAFCIEYKRYYEFQNNEDIKSFHSHLPIQLDATCNGFQHMSLLSNEKALFKELNLEKDSIQDKPKDFYNFLLHKLIDKFDVIIEANKDKDLDSFVRLRKFVWERSYIKKAIMTIPYNVSVRNMKTYVCSSIHKVNKNKLTEEEASKKVSWYSACEDMRRPYINDKDITLLISTLNKIIFDNFLKIRKLTKYLKNIATILTAIDLPVEWRLPHGLTICQSYLETKSISITPFMYSKSKINIQITVKNKYDKNRLVRSLMPNLIHSLDATSLSLLYNKFINVFDNPQFFSVHDCFGTTIDKVETLKTLLASVYVDIYSNDHYLDRFDSHILDCIDESTPHIVDRENRTVFVDNTQIYHLHDIEWVKNNRDVKENIIKEIDSQYLLV